MNDRYLYRAKRTDNGEWTSGSYINTFTEDKECPCAGIYKENYWIVEENGNMIVVDPSTICQCTGLKKFYEKDIVKRIDIHKVGDPSIGIIEYDVENTAFVIHWIDKQKYSPMYPWKDKIEVIGNIFDNPELLE